MATIETPPLGNYKFLLRKQLDGIFFRFGFSFNLRDRFWYLSVGNDQSQSQVRNIKLCLASDIFAPYKNRRTVPQGILDVVDTSLTGTESGRDELGSRVILDYTPVSALTTTTALGVTG